nr:MAG TPA: tail fiber assembly protein [Siphoviridae sp. ctD5s5]
MEQEKLVEGFRLPVDEKGEYDVEVYSAMAEVCNKNQELTIVDHRPEYFSLEKIPEPTVEEKSNQVKSIRNQYMSEVLNKTERYETQKAAGIETTDSEETYRSYLLYLQYLRDVPQDKDFPDVEVLTFEAWSDK